ncbi:hypothetical protein OG874_26365 [Nocardia sp. NBC_00565]|uniref:hypothetical protein n=1 Tax=Nocardia sp. NBC_00565 TaxID=2975993 RepID=UPI002E8223D3|nr:hypothetical protein [Nocardia sp. NBC_00565]WUC00408.1 hypothetical protein OG874_26365 [Nocardia sp. NBC_00565]
MDSGLQPESTLTQDFRLTFLVSAAVLAIATVVVGFGITRAAGTGAAADPHPAVPATV